MKRRYVILTIASVSGFLFSLIAFSMQVEATRGSGPRNRLKEEETVSSDSKNSDAHIKFEKTVHNFGDIDPSSKQPCIFNFTNVGSDVLRIKKVSKTCGCTGTVLDKKKYAPGESGKLKVTYSASRRPGNIKKKIYVSTNDREKPRVTLTIMGRVVSKIKCEPSKLTLSPKKENAGCPEITLTSVDRKKFAILTFRSTPSCITADFDTKQKSRKHVIQPKVDVKKLQENKSGFVHINVTHGSNKIITVPFSVLPDFTIRPAGLALLAVEPEKPLTRELWVLNNNEEDFEIESISSEKGYVKVISQEKLEARYKIELQISPPVSEDKKMFQDKIFVQIKEGEKISVPCFGVYAKK